MKGKAFWVAVAAIAGAVSVVWAQQAQPGPELLEAKEFFETAGIPGQ